MKLPRARALATSARIELAAVVGIAPYMRTTIRSKKGWRHTAFAPVTAPLAQEWKLHNGYLKPNHFGDPVQEYWAMRRVAGLWDVTGEEVIEIAGPEALAVMNELVPRDLSRLEDGMSLYCIMCYDHGGIVEDGILVRFSAERLWWVGGPAPAEEWIYAHAHGRDVTVRSFHEEIHVASLQGPRSRDLLAGLAEADIAALPFFGMVETEVCGVPVVITRTGYTAELGYDIYVEVPRGAELFAALWAALEPEGVALCGSRALDLRRTEAAILNIGQEFDMRVSPLEIGLDKLINWKKGEFRGRAALARQREAGVHRRLAGLRLDGDLVAVPGEAVVSGGRAVGEITTGNWSPALEASLAIAMVQVDAAVPGTRLAVDMAGTEVPATVVPMPFLDPERRLSKA